MELVDGLVGKPLRWVADWFLRWDIAIGSMTVLVFAARKTAAQGRAESASEVTALPAMRCGVWCTTLVPHQ